MTAWMRRAASLVLLAGFWLSAAPARARGLHTDPCGAYSEALPERLHLSFDDCRLASTDRWRSLNCTDSAATTVVVASVVVATTYEDLLADAGVVDVYVGLDWTTMPAFWQFHQSGCAGPEQLQFSADFSGYTRCADLWGGAAFGGGVYGGRSGPVPDGKAARIKWSWAVQPSSPRRIEAGMETYVCRVVIRQEHIGRCPGCESPACAVFVEEALSLLSGTTHHIWTGDAIVLNCPQGNQCVPTPARASTWGAVKALYR